MTQRRLLLLAFGFPPAAKSSAYRLLEIANQFAAKDWHVTVLNAPDAAWEADTGLDRSLSARVDPRVRVVHADVVREDLETDIRAFSRQRAASPSTWLKRYREASLEDFPEPVFGGWRATIEQTVLDLHDEEPFDLVFASCVPYVLLAAGLRLHEDRGVPFAADFRDGWSIDVVGGEVAFDEDSVEGAWERKALTEAVSLWVVNEPIAEHYRRRYPELAHKVHVVRNGFDDVSLAPIEGERAPGPLRFGYLGTVNFGVRALEAVIEAWVEARSADPLLADATFEIRGYLGGGARRQALPHLGVIRRAAEQGVSYGGPVQKGDVGSVYGGWDALVLILIGGGYVTSGKVYEYLASGLPVVSAHETVHDAADLLRDYPGWTGSTGLEHDLLVRAFRDAARIASNATPQSRAIARAHAETYRRSRLMEPAVARLIEQVEA